LQTLTYESTVPEAEKNGEVYTDESYIHEHYNKNNDLFWDLNHKQDVMTEKSKYKGFHYCFVAAVQ
jgi:hypothetical protein